jgi:hypothetical protein
MTMLRFPVLRSLGCLVLASFSLLRAQQAPAQPTTAKPASDAVMLSPFQVNEDARDAYQATNTNSLTGLSTSLNEVPVDARILSRTMITELGAAISSSCSATTRVWVRPFSGVAMRISVASNRATACSPRD